MCDDLLLNNDVDWWMGMDVDEMEMLIQKWILEREQKKSCFAFGISVKHFHKKLSFVMSRLQQTVFPVLRDANVKMKKHGTIQQHGELSPRLLSWVTSIHVIIEGLIDYIQSDMGTLFAVLESFVSIGSVPDFVVDGFKSFVRYWHFVYRQLFACIQWEMVACKKALSWVCFYANVSKLLERCCWTCCSSSMENCSDSSHMIIEWFFPSSGVPGLSSSAYGDVNVVFPHAFLEYTRRELVVIIGREFEEYVVPLDDGMKIVDGGGCIVKAVRDGRVCMVNCGNFLEVCVHILQVCTEDANNGCFSLCGMLMSWRDVGCL